MTREDRKFVLDVMKSDKGTVMYKLYLIGSVLLRVAPQIVVAWYTANEAKTSILSELMRWLHDVPLLRVDLASAFVAILAYMYNPRQVSYEKVMEMTQTQRLMHRVVNYFVWSVIPCAVYIAIKTF